jgi:hypothetical protein
LIAKVIFYFSSILIINLLSSNNPGDNPMTCNLSLKI